jgi:hypothetical protein
MNKTELLERASDKAFSQITMNTIDVNRIKDEIKRNELGALTVDQMESMLNLHKTELKVWNFIAELIEKSNNNGK